MKKATRLLSVITFSLAGCGGKKQDPKIIEALQETINLERSSALTDFRVSDTYLANATALNIQIVYGGVSNFRYGDMQEVELEVTKYTIKQDKKQKYFFFAQPYVTSKELGYTDVVLAFRIFLKYNKVIAPLPYVATAFDTVSYCLKGDYTSPPTYVGNFTIIEVCTHAEDIVKGNYTYTSY